MSRERFGGHICRKWRASTSVRQRHSRSRQRILQRGTLSLIMSSGAPEWVDAALVQRALRGAGEGAVRVLGVAGESMRDAGEDFTSRLLRLRVRGQRDQSASSVTHSLILKCESDEEALRENGRQYFFFRREVASYTRIIPQIHEMLERAAPGRFPPFAPRCLLHGEEPFVFLILDDLCEQGFRVADRVRGLGLRHSLLAITALARFHAASAALLARDPSVASLLPTPWKENKEERFRNVVELCFQKAAEACRSWSDFPIEYSEYLERIKSRAYDKFSELAEAIPGEFNVINHADYWTNNIMYRYEEGVPVEIRMIDFQICNVSSPTGDILRFLYTSLAEDVLENHFDLLIREYHVALEDTLELLGMSSPSLEDLWKDINARGFWALHGGVLSLPFVRAEKGQAPNMDKALKRKGGITTEVFSSPRFSRWLKNLLLDFRKRGWLCEGEFQCHITF